jgi:hypothetical protein
MVMQPERRDVSAQGHPSGKKRKITGKTTWERDHDDWDIGDASDTTM